MRPLNRPAHMYIYWTLISKVMYVCIAKKLFVVYSNTSITKTIKIFVSAPVMVAYPSDQLTCLLVVITSSNCIWYLRSIVLYTYVQRYIMYCILGEKIKGFNVLIAIMCEVVVTKLSLGSDIMLRVLT